MKETPIFFNGAMVRAILAGAKTQTRRPVIPMRGRQSEWLTTELINRSPKLEIAPLNKAQHGRDAFGAQMEHPLGGPLGWVGCPYGAPGDRLWVRETWAYWPLVGEHDKKDGVTYRATDEGEWECRMFNWRPSIHMPRWANRILLEVVSVRVERLQDISDADAEAEGVMSCEHELVDDFCAGLYAPSELLSMLWSGLYGTDSWRANPWVWVVEFKVVTP